MDSQVIIPTLPSDLSFEIMLRLPIKSLLRFTTISKSWNSIITSSTFTKSHLQTSLSNPNSSHHHLLYSIYSYSTAHHFPISSLFHNPPNFVPQDIRYPVQNLTGELLLIGSINGLVCIATNEKSKTDTHIIWNPSTRKSKTLPVLERMTSCSTVYGFGYDSIAEDYKVVAIICVRKDRACENYVKIYSQKSDSWKNIEGFKSRLPLDNVGMFVNGKLHWAPYLKVLDGISISIVSIDAGDGSYRELDQPNYREGKFNGKLGALGERLCVLCTYGKVQVDFWVMKEYGVAESWTKLSSLSLDWGETYIYYAPLGLLNNGEILLRQSNTCMLYNPKDGSCRSICLLSDWALGALIYVESFVLP